MKKYTAIITVFIGLCLAVPVWAQTPVIAFPNVTKCTEFSWPASTAVDLAEYRVYVTRDGLAMPYVSVPPTEITIACTALAIVVGSEHEVYVTAVDTSGNESDPSPIFRFLYVIPDTTAPATPEPFCFIGETAGGIEVVRCQ